MKRLILLILLEFSTIATPAEAAKLMMVFSGTVSGVDIGGVFSDAGTSLEGSRFSAAVDLELEPGGGYLSEDRYRWTGRFDRIAVTIRGRTQGMDDARGPFAASNNVPLRGTDHFSVSACNANSHINLAVDGHFFERLSLAPATYFMPEGLYSGYAPAGYGPGSTFLTLRSYQLDILPVQGAVPEPSTWAMLIAGFGAAGARMRWQRRRQAVSVNA